MSRRSLFARLCLAATVLILLALVLAAFGLRAIFNREIERRASDELTQIVKTIAAQVRIDADGAPTVDAALADPRFETPYGGLYWQVSRADGRSARSRSLWDYELAGANAAADGTRMVINLDGPNATRLLGVAQSIVVPSPAGDDVTLRLIAALDRNDLAASQRSFLYLLLLSLAALGGILLLAMAFFIRLALRPFSELSRGLQEIRSGATRSLSGDFPDEVQSVVDDLNRLVVFHDSALERARVHASDLAHGLKTPLAVLGAIGRQAASDGRHDIAKPIEEQVAQMGRQVDRVLARARAGLASTLGHKRTPVGPVVEKIVRAFRRLADSRDLTWESDATADAIFPGDDGDLTEILGNLLDNARKWAKSRVRVVAATTPDGLSLRVEDDGAGLPLDRASEITRGQRWDESKPGTGFGLAITRDIVESHRGTLELSRSDLGGLRVTITIPVPRANPRKP